MRERAAEAWGVPAQTPRVLGLVWRAHPGYALAVLVLNAIQGFTPLVMAWIAKLVIDTVAGAIADPPAVDGSPEARGHLLSLIAVASVVGLVTQALWPAVRFVWYELSDFLTRDITARVLRKANSLADISFFESPRFYDFLHQAHNEAGYRPMSVLNVLTYLLRTGLNLAGMFVALLVFDPPIALGLLALQAPYLIVQFKRRRMAWQITSWQVPEVRRMQYYAERLTTKGAASEVRLFGLGEYFFGQYLHTFDRYHETFRRLRVGQWRWEVLLGVLAATATAVAYGSVVLRALDGAITIGDASFYFTAIYQVQGSISGIIWQVAELYAGNLFVRHTFDFLAMPPVISSPAEPTPVPAPLRKGIEFRHVAFRYPDSDRAVLEDVSFTIRAGQAVALVGENGAGKTTLIKLLSRLYDPSGGEILVDGVNLREVDLDEWRRRIGVVFQDYARYNMLARENIGLGSLPWMEDLGRVREAAESGGAAAVVDRLPNTYDAMLGRQFASAGSDGVDLSGGEWQKIALSRAFMRAPSADKGRDGSTDGASEVGEEGGAELLILDEPTASLDARAEHEVFQRFSELTRGRTTLLVSHRFSTVRMADHIVVLDGGRVIEQGGHADLIARGGEYARLYAMQADRYQ